MNKQNIDKRKSSRYFNENSPQTKFQHITSIFIISLRHGDNFTYYITLRSSVHVSIFFLSSSISFISPPNRQIENKTEGSWSECPLREKNNVLKKFFAINIISLCRELYIFFFPFSFLKASKKEGECSQYKMYWLRPEQTKTSIRLKKWL